MADGQTHDAVVIGAGLGGLVAGAKLAREGWDVLVLEQHSIPGGCATTFDRRDFEFEVSLHEIDGLDENDIKRDIFAELDLLDGLSFEPISEFYRYRRGDRDVVVPHERTAACERLTSEFPEEADAIRTFYDVIVEMREALLDFAGAGEQSFRSLISFSLRNRTFIRYRNTTLETSSMTCLTPRHRNVSSRPTSATTTTIHIRCHSRFSPWLKVATSPAAAIISRVGHRNSRTVSKRSSKTRVGPSKPAVASPTFSSAMGLQPASTTNVLALAPQRRREKIHGSRIPMPS